MFQPSWDDAYDTTSAGVSPVSSLAGDTMSVIRPATRPSPPTAARTRAHPFVVISVRVTSSVVLVTSPSCG